MCHVPPHSAFISNPAASSSVGTPATYTSTGSVMNEPPTPEQSQREPNQRG